MDTKGYNQLKAIIGEIMDAQDWPEWDFLNGVLSCKKLLGDKELWFWFGNLLIVTAADRKMKHRAGDMRILDDWNTEKDGTITLLAGKQLNDVKV